MTRYNAVVKNERLADVWGDIQVVEADLRNLESLCSVMADAKPEAIFHLAAYNHVGQSFTHYQECFDVNAKGTANLLHASKSSHPVFVYMSTSEVYGYQEECPFHERFAPEPISPYAITKYAGELYCRMKQLMETADVRIVRCFNTYGPWQSEKAIIPDIIGKCLRGEEIRCTEGKQTREFNFVDDIVDGLVLALMAKPFDGPVNIGCGVETPIRSLVEKIAELTGAADQLKIGAIGYRPTEIWRMAADVSLAKNLFDYAPSVSLDEGMKRTVEWFRERHENSRLDARA